MAKLFMENKNFPFHPKKIVNGLEINLSGFRSGKKFTLNLIRKYLFDVVRKCNVILKERMPEHLWNQMVAHMHYGDDPKDIQTSGRMERTGYSQKEGTKPPEGKLHTNVKEVGHIFFDGTSGKPNEDLKKAFLEGQQTEPRPGQLVSLKKDFLGNKKGLLLEFEKKTNLDFYRSEYRYYFKCLDEEGNRLSFMERELKEYIDFGPSLFDAYQKALDGQVWPHPRYNESKIQQTELIPNQLVTLKNDLIDLKKGMILKFIHKSEDGSYYFRSIDDERKGVSLSKKGLENYIHFGPPATIDPSWFYGPLRENKNEETVPPYLYSQQPEKIEAVYKKDVPINVGGNPELMGGDVPTFGKHVRLKKDFENYKAGEIFVFSGIGVGGSDLVYFFDKAGFLNMSDAPRIRVKGISLHEYIDLNPDLEQVCSTKDTFKAGDYIKLKAEYLDAALPFKFDKKAKYFLFNNPDFHLTTFLARNMENKAEIFIFNHKKYGNFFEKVPAPADAFEPQYCVPPKKEKNKISFNRTFTKGFYFNTSPLYNRMLFWFDGEETFLFYSDNDAFKELKIKDFPEKILEKFYPLAGEVENRITGDGDFVVIKKGEMDWYYVAKIGSFVKDSVLISIRDILKTYIVPQRYCYKDNEAQNPSVLAKGIAYGTFEGKTGKQVEEGLKDVAKDIQDHFRSTHISEQIKEWDRNLHKHVDEALSKLKEGMMNNKEHIVFKIPVLEPGEEIKKIECTFEITPNGEFSTVKVNDKVVNAGSEKMTVGSGLARDKMDDIVKVGDFAPGEGSDIKKDNMFPFVFPKLPVSSFEMVSSKQIAPRFFKLTKKYAGLQKNTKLVLQGLELSSMSDKSPFKVLETAHIADIGRELRVPHEFIEEIKS